MNSIYVYPGIRKGTKALVGEWLIHKKQGRGSTV